MRAFQLKPLWRSPWHAVTIGAHDRRADNETVVALFSSIRAAKKYAAELGFKKCRKVPMNIAVQRAKLVARLYARSFWGDLMRVAQLVDAIIKEKSISRRALIVEVPRKPS